MSSAMSQSMHAGMMPSTSAPAAPAGCSDLCLDYLVIEIVRYYYAGQEGVNAVQALETLGFRVGSQLAERLSFGLPRLTEPLEKVKFICKDFWSKVFKKTVDGLKTNHKGTFVVEDKTLKWLIALQSSHADLSTPLIGAPGDTEESEHQDPMRQQRKDLIQLYITLACGFLRGALYHLNLPCTVSGDTTGAPHCTPPPAYSRPSAHGPTTNANC